MLKIPKILISLSILTSSLLATNVTDKIIEAKRIQKVDNIISKENLLYKRVVKYIKETGDLTPTRQEIQNRYNLSLDTFSNYQGEDCSNSSGICNDNTSGGITLTVDVTNNQIILGNILGDTSTLSPIETNRFMNSPQKDPSAETNTSSYNRKFIITDNKDLEFIVKIVNAANNNSKTILQLAEPSSSYRNRMWLKPVGDGSFDALMWNSTLSKWQSRGTIANTYNPNGAGIVPELTFYLNDGFDTITTLGQKGWMANVENAYGFSQYKHNGTEWVQVTVADSKIYTFSDITDLMTSHMNDPLGSVISGVSIPNSSLVVEFTKYSKYWATKDGMFFVINDKVNLPLTIKNGARAWAKNGNLILEYDSTINSWIIVFVDLDDWKNKRGYLADKDYLKLTSDGKKYKFFQAAGEMIAALDGMNAYIMTPSQYPLYSPESLGLKENAIVTDYLWNAFHSTVKYAPYQTPYGTNTLQFYATSTWSTWINWVALPSNAYIVLDNGSYCLWAKDYYWTNFKISTAKVYFQQLGWGTRVGNTMTGLYVPAAEAGQKLYADRDGGGSYYWEIVEYTGQSNGTWVTTASGVPSVNYTFGSFDEAYPSNLPFQDAQTAFFNNNNTQFYTWISGYKVWSPIASAQQVIPVKYNKQFQLGNITLNYVGVTNDGQWYYTKVYPADTYNNAQMNCSRQTKEWDSLPSKLATTAGGGSVATESADYYWTTDTNVAGTRIVFNGTNTKVASENTAYPYRCVRHFDGQYYLK